MKAIAFVAYLLGFERILFIVLALMAVAIAQHQGLLPRGTHRVPVTDPRPAGSRAHAQAGP